jgi:hypothetical protein
MADCTHPYLTHIVNIEMGGEKSTTYRCTECRDLFTVTLEPSKPVVVSYTYPEAQ